MIITKETLWITVRDAIDVLRTGEAERLRETAVRSVFGNGGYYDMTIEQFDMVLHNHVGELLPSLTTALPLAFEYLAAEGLVAFAEDYVRKLERFTPPQTADELRASGSTIKSSATEAFLVFARDYFSLPSFAAAAKTTLADLLIAKKDAYNKIMYQRAITKKM